MKDEDKTKEQLIRELGKLRRRISGLEALEAEHLSTEMALKQAEQEKRTILDSLVEHVVYHDMEMRVLWANRAACGSVDMNREELLGRHCYEIWAKRSEPCEDCPVKLARETGQPQALEKTTPDGRSWYIQGSPVRNSDGDTVGMVELTLEISERKRAEEAHRQSEEKYRLLVMNLPSIVFRAYKDWSVEFIDGKVELLTGLKVEDFNSRRMKWCDVIVSEDIEPAKRIFIQALKTDKSYVREYRITTRTAGILWIQERGHILCDKTGEIEYVDGVFFDITEQKRAEEALRKAHDELERRVQERTVELIKANQQLKLEIEERKRVEDALRESEETLKAILAASPVGICLVRNRILDWANQAMYQIWGYQEGSLLGQSTRVFYPEAEEYERVGREFYSDIEEKGFGHIETRFVTEDGRETHCYLQGCSLDPSDFSKGVIVAAMDITERKRAEEVLQESERRYRLLAENVTDVIWTMDMNLRMTYESPSVTQLRGYTVEEAMAQTLEDILTPASLEVARKALAEELAREKTVQKIPDRSRTLELELRCKDGSTVWTEVKAKLLRDPEGKPIGILGVTRDISERKQAEERVRIYQDQLRSLSSELSLTEERERRRLATDLHDSIGQILAVAKLKMDALRSGVSSDTLAGELDEILELLKQVIQQTRSLTFQLSPPVLHEFGLEAALEDLIVRMQEEYDIRLEFADDSQPKALSEDLRVLLFRAVQELLINVVKHAQARKAEIFVGREEDYLLIRVEDDGIGFDVSEIDFDVGRAGKFGVFSIKERLNHLGGRFEIVSKPGQGTQVTLAAPCLESTKRKLV